MIVAEQGYIAAVIRPEVCAKTTHINLSALSLITESHQFQRP